MPLLRRHRGGGAGAGVGRMKGHHSEDDESTPICRCRVLYLGSAVPHITKDGLQGIQEPLKELYPDTGLSSLKGIDSWLSVWSNGLLLENVDEKNTKITRFFPIESLHYCAAVRNVIVPSNSGSCNSSLANGASSSEKAQKFLPLDSPFAQLPNLNHPPLFACILRRTTGIKVLECHAFICKREMAANALVRCCFHAYADSTYAKQLETGGTLVTPSTNGGSSTLLSNGFSNGTIFKDSERPIQRSVTPLDSIEKVAGWQALSQNGDADIIVLPSAEDYTDGPMSSSTPRDKLFEFKAEFPDEDEIYEGDENHKIWSGNNSTLGHNGTSSELVYLEPDGTLKSIKSHASRISRPRQFISPPPPPPPPPQQFSLLKSAEEDVSLSKKKMKKKMKKEIKQQQKGNGQYLIRPASMMNLSTNPPHALVHSNGRSGGSLINGPVHRPNSAMSTLTRQQPPSQQHHHQQHHQQQQQQQLIAVPHMHNGYTMMPVQPPQPIYGHPYALGHHPQPIIKGVKSKKNKNKPTLLTAVPILAPAPHHRLGPNIHPHYQPHLVPATVMNHPAPSSTLHREEMRMKGPPPDMLMMQHPSPAQYATIERGYRYKSRPLNGDSTTLISNKSKSLQPNPRLLPNRDISTFNGNGTHNKDLIGGHNNHSNSNSRNRDNSYNLNNGNGVMNNGHDSKHRQRRNSSPFNTGIYNNHASHNNTDSNSSSRNGGPQDPENSPYNTGIYRKKSQQSNHNNTDSSSSRNKSQQDPEGSPFNTGIYRKKGHLNERAFSYSIRQEHRSRSYGSLTNLHFANSNETGEMLHSSSSRPSGSPPRTAEGIKKEREIIQMVRDLDLSGDQIERSQVPSDLYPPRKLIANGYRQQNGHGPRITHR